MRERLTRAVGALVLLTVVPAHLSGCTSVVNGTGSPAVAPSSPPGASQLEAALLQLGDLPAGWTAGDGPERDSGAMERFAACLGSPQDPDDRLDEALSPSFTDPSGNRVFSSVGRYRTQQGIEDVVALFSDPAAPSCFGQALVASLEDAALPPGARVGAPDVAVTPGGAGGPSNLVATVTASVPVAMPAGEPQTLVYQYCFLTGRSTQAVVGFGSYGAVLPHELRYDAVETVAERIADL